MVKKLEKCQTCPVTDSDVGFSIDIVQMKVIKKNKEKRKNM